MYVLYLTYCTHIFYTSPITNYEVQTSSRLKFTKPHRYHRQVRIYTPIGEDAALLAQVHLTS